MTKRARITALITTLCVCISLFVVGVLAATTASLSVTSTLKFSADGVYVMVDASLKQGADVSSAQVLSGEGAPTGKATYKAYSYPRETGQDYPNGEPSTTHFVDSTGAQASTWAIGDITYTSENVVVVYEFLVSNYSEFEVTGTVEGISEALASYADQLSITTYTGTASSDATATSSPTYTFNIPARTSETTPGQACYKIAVTLNKFTSDIETGLIDIGITFEEYIIEPVYEYFTYDYYNNVKRITGFSDTYLNLETKPETLVIPSTDGEGNNITTIADGSYSSAIFQGLESSKVIIQEDITSIGDYAFNGCGSLISVILPSTLKSIDFHTFSNCNGLTGEITIPEGVVSIGGYAFNGCSGLTGITLPSSLTSIGNNAFEGCSGLTGEIVIPEGVTRIGTSAFEGCSGLTGELTIPEGVTRIEWSVFEGCSGLTGELAIPEGVTEIGWSAFEGCSGLTSVTLPSTLTSIEYYAFNGCNGLKSINYLGTIPQWCAIEFKASSSNPIYFAHSIYLQGEEVTNLVIPENVTSIGEYAFNGCCGLTGITLPNSLTSIGGYAFEGCSGLTGALTIPDGVTSIGGYAFEDCSGLIAITLPSALTTIESSTFSRCNGLTSIVIPDGVTSIESHAFYNCKGLTGELVIPDGVKSIGGQVFEGCSGLTSVTLPSTLTSIGGWAFRDCSGIKTMNYLGTLSQWCAINFGGFYSNPTELTHSLYIQGEEVTNLEIPEGVTSIGRYAFAGCSGLTSVIISESVTSIGEDAFYNCLGIKSMNYLGTISQWYAMEFENYDSNPVHFAHSLYIQGVEITNLVIPEGMTSIGDWLFSGCRGLTSVTLPRTLTSIGNGTFYECSGLTGEFVIPEGVTSIGKSTFSGCRGLTNVVIPEGVTSIGDNAFYNCKGLSGEFVIPEGVISIGIQSFSGCSGLTSVTLPSTLTSIGAYAFSDCSNLTSLTINTQAGYVWQKASFNSPTASWTTVDLSNPTQNATWFKGTSDYYNYYWRQIEKSEV